MPNNVGNTDQVLNTGRIAYGHDGTNAYPVKVDTSGRQILGAGTTIVGKVGIDQTTPGTTNAVDLVPVKTIQTELLAITSVAASTQQLSSVLSLTGVKKATFFIDHGRTVVTAFGTNGTEYRVEASQKATGNDTWVPIASVVASSAVAVAVVADADVAAGTTVIACGTAVAAVGDRVFWANSTAASSSEWMKVVAVSGTVSFTVQDALTYGQDADTNIFTQAERWALLVDTSALTRARVVVNNNASGTTFAVYSRVACITES